MATRVWYVTANRAAVNWGTAVVGGVATTRIYKLTDTAGTSNDQLSLWAATGQAVSAAKVSAAQAETSGDAIPAAPAPNPPRVTSFEGIKVASLRHTGTLGVFGAAPVAQPTALTAADATAFTAADATAFTAADATAFTAANATAFTAADAAVVDATYGTEEAGVIANLRTRLAENEAVTANLRTRLAENETVTANLRTRLAEVETVTGNLRTRLGQIQTVTGNVRTRLNDLQARLQTIGLLP